MEHRVVYDLLWNPLRLQLANELKFSDLSNVLVRRLALLCVHANAAFLAHKKTNLVEKRAALYTVSPRRLRYRKALVQQMKVLANRNRMGILLYVQ